MNIAKNDAISYTDKIMAENRGITSWAGQKKLCAFCIAHAF